MPASQRRAPHRRDLIYRYFNRPGITLGDIDGGIDGVDPMRHEEALTETDYARVQHGFGISPGTGILFDSAGEELEVAWSDDLAGSTVNLYFNGTVTGGLVIFEAHPEERFQETFTATSTYVVTHNLGRTPASVVAFTSSGEEVEVAWDDTSADTTTLLFNGTLTDAVVRVEASDEFRHDETFTATSTYRVTHGFGVSPGAVILFDSTGVEVVVAWADDGAGAYIDINFNGTLTNARVLVSAVDTRDYPASAIHSYHVVIPSVTKTANYTTTDRDGLVKLDATAGDFTVTLIPAASFDGRRQWFKRIDATANVVTIDGNASETIDRDLTADLLSEDEVICILSDGANWEII